MMISCLSWHQIIEGVFSDCSHGQPYGSGIWWCCQTTMRCDTSCKSGSRSSSHLVQRRASFSNLQLSDLRSCFESAGLNPMFEKYSWLYQLWSRPAPVMLNRDNRGDTRKTLAGARSTAPRGPTTRRPDPSARVAIVYFLLGTMGTAKLNQPEQRASF
ncbi:unnamed protein product [Nesidiocoris tenuis]|uniref:Uncharacterized protein n=1 Tax=Nesidiocoris tenuis TaxID=355587 RepID=A0A6H5GQH5_9HEMI|nr:unnamed protein product [Nesidiocoris tenuis]